MPITYTQVITINNQLGTSSEIRNPRARALKKIEIEKSLRKLKLYLHLSSYSLTLEKCEASIIE